MNESLIAPAQTYQLNVVASVLGRFAAHRLTSADISDLSDILGYALDMISEQDTPPVPHTNPILLEESVRFDQKLEAQVQDISIKNRLPQSLLDFTRLILANHRMACSLMLDKNATTQILVNPDSIAKAYQLPDLWQSSAQVIEDEFSRWGKYAKHPLVPLDLSKKISALQTIDLIKVMSKHITNIDLDSDTKVYTTGSKDRYHLFWAPIEEGLDYVTPDDYDIATQLSFDMPHNVSHLSHLSQLKNAGGGVNRYYDTMAQRAYFEAVAVLSEYSTTEQIQDNQDFVDDLSKAISLREITNDDLAEWILKDRGYEFKLRVARYAADALMIECVDFEEAVQFISSKLNIPIADVSKETRKYLPWTGLGAVYSFGYRKLLANGINRVRDAIITKDGTIATTWSNNKDIII